METKTKKENDDVLYDPVETEEKYNKYPKAIFIIVLNEFCERFSYSGMRAFLALYLTQKLLYTDDEATEIYHIFTTMAYFFGIVGAILADSFIGKFRTILYLMVIYAVGNVLIAVTAIPHFNIPGREFTLLSLMMVALGTGGIKPCVSAFGGDQFVLPQQEKQLTTFFTMFYFILCLASLVAKTISPLLRSQVQCFGDKDCFSLAFGAPGLLIIISIVLFGVAKRFYIMKNPAGNVLVDVTKCILTAIRNRKQMRNKKDTKEKNHWLDYASDDYDQKFIDNVKKTLRIFLLFTPLPVFWALLDQLGSRWTLQATKMDGDFGFITIKPDQMIVICPIAILILIPIFKDVIYPFLSRYNILTNLLHRLIAGSVLAGIAYICIGLLEMRLNETSPILPSKGNGQLRIFNSHSNCSLHFSNETTNDNFTISPLNMHVSYRNIENTLDLTYTKQLICKDYVDEADVETFILEEGKAISYIFKFNDTESEVVRYKDHINTARSGLPYMRVITNFQDEMHEVALIDLYKGKTELKVFTSLSGMTEVFAGKYILYVNDTKLPLPIEVRTGGVYSIIVEGSEDTGYTGNIITVTEPNSVSMAWVLPQIIIISTAEVLFAITGLEFAFREAPEGMKAVMQAYWLITEAVGNIIIIIVIRLGSGFQQVYHFFFFAILVFLSAIIFFLLTLRYQRQKEEDHDYNQPYIMELNMNDVTVTSQQRYMELLQIDDTLDR